MCTRHDTHNPACSQGGSILATYDLPCNTEGAVRRGTRHEARNHLASHTIRRSPWCCGYIGPSSAPQCVQLMLSCANPPNPLEDGPLHEGGPLHQGHIGIAMPRTLVIEASERPRGKRYGPPNAKVYHTSPQTIGAASWGPRQPAGGRATEARTCVHAGGQLQGDPPAATQANRPAAPPVAAAAPARGLVFFCSEAGARGSTLSSQSGATIAGFREGAGVVKGPRPVHGAEPGGPVSNNDSWTARQRPSLTTASLKSPPVAEQINYPKPAEQLPVTRPEDVPPAIPASSEIAKHLLNGCPKMSNDCFGIQNSPQFRPFSVVLAKHWRMWA